LNIMVEPTPANLQLLDAGTLGVPNEHSHRLEQAGEALGRCPAPTPRGKLSLTVA